MRVGIVLDACCAGLHMRAQTARDAGFQPGDYLRLASDECGTQIIRRLTHCHAGKLQGDYVFLDPQSAHYLACDLHAPVSVKKADYDMEMP